LIKIALPKGDIQEKVREFLLEKGLDFSGYKKEARSYASRTRGEKSVFSKQFRQKDIPIQVSMGNYDLGLCGTLWVAEYMRKFPRADILNLRTVSIPCGTLCVCCAIAESGEKQGDDILEEMIKRGTVRIASEFPALAEEWALKKKIPDFRIFPLWGAAEAYPPEGAEFIMISVKQEGILEENDLNAIEYIYPSRVSVIANREHFENKNLSFILDKLT